MWTGDRPLSTPVWIDSDQQAYASLSGNIDVDVAIVGGGLSGLGAAWALRDSGVSVALLESGTLSSGASGRNAGFVLAGPASSYRIAKEVLGGAAALDVWQFTMVNNRLIGAIIDQFAIDCSYIRRGSMSLAVSDEELRDLEDAHCLLIEDGISTDLVQAVDLPRPFDRMYVGGLYYPGNAEINPGLFVRSVGALVADRVRIFERSGVRSLRANETWLLDTDGGRVRSRIVIVCTNAYTIHLLPRVPIKPIRGQVLATAPLRHLVVPFPMYANFGYQYWRQTPEGRLIVGGWRDTDMVAEVGENDEINDGIQSKLSAFAQTIARYHHVETRWAGIMGFTPDLFPLVGAVAAPHPLYVAAGYSGHGVSMAFLSGVRVSQMALGETVAIPSAFNPGRFAQV